MLSSSVCSFRSLSALTLLGIAALGLAAHPAAAQGLNGQPIEVAFGRGQTPSTANYANDAGTKVVTPAGATFNFAGGVDAFVTPNQIVLSSNTSSFSPSGMPFTGFGFFEVGNYPQVITGVTLGSTSVSGFGANRLSFDANTIYANFSGLTINKGQSVTINLTTAPVPEASTTVSLGLMLALGGLAFAAKRKKAHAA